MVRNSVTPPRSVFVILCEEMDVDRKKKGIAKRRVGSCQYGTDSSVI